MKYPRIKMIKKIETTQAPAAIGPYSQGIVTTIEPHQKMIFVSGMLPINPETGKLIEGDITTLTKRVMQNLEAILKAGGSSLANVVRTDVFLKDLKNDFAQMNEEYSRWFTDGVPPARQTVQVAELPLGSKIEISCIAIAGYL
jgi:2-iminobutanoate/2-iminopropanoate deaminase